MDDELFVDGCCAFFFPQGKQTQANMRPFLSVLISVPFSAVIIWNCQQLIRELFAESELIMLRGKKGQN